MTIKSLSTDMEFLLGHIRNDFLKEFGPHPSDDVKNFVRTISDEYQSYIRRYLNTTDDTDCYHIIDVCIEKLDEAYNDTRNNLPKMRRLLYELRNGMADTLNVNRQALFESCFKDDDKSQFDFTYEKQKNEFLNYGNKISH